MKMTFSIPAADGDVWTREAADSVVGSIFKFQDKDVMVEKVEFDEDEPGILKASFTYISDRELEVLLVQAISLTEERITNEMPGIDPIMARDTNGRFLMLDAYTTLANFRASVARTKDLGADKAEAVKESVESYLSDSPNRPTMNKL
jgi:hypothetical protein